MQIALAPSSDTVMMAVPAFFALIIPFWLTAATDVFLEIHLGVLPDDTLATKVISSPGFSVTEVLLNFMTGGFTVTSHIFLIPSTVAVISAVPCFSAVTYPFSSTFATLVLFDFHTGFIFDETSAVIFADCPLYMLNEEGLSLTVGVLTFTLHWTVVLSALTDIIASPGLQPVTVPFSSTTATLVLLLL